MNKYRLYWLDGKTHVVEGHDIADAMNRTGFGNGSLPALDFYDTTDEQRYQWDSVSRTWYNAEIRAMAGA
jgi:hypothetical protein